ncbi:mitochondrial fission ELM1 family protein [Alkalimarinus coralli]|uniref:mitochondrial fission ELM1 family protein n=1 Tax=Alkalimarinus coralli TaxID=2935863 RepID=UPI00202B80B4|nr:mitochondrial fission ELM1 family protein [Alkalimarinus coralli]
MQETQSTRHGDKPQLPLNIWIVTDHKPGHLNQLKGLCERVAAHAPTKEQWISVEDLNSTLLDCLIKKLNIPTKLRENKPDIVIGAGHSTHTAVLAVQRYFQCFSVLLMKPSLPLSWFNAVIIPEHDNPKRRRQTLATKGVLNTITPSHSNSGANISTGLILIGGDSKHYHWNTADVMQQVTELTQAHLEIKWTLSDSRRTENEFLDQLKHEQLSNVHIVPHLDTPNGWVKEKMAQAGQIWVTPDSVSMVYEAVTAGVPVGLFNMLPKKNGRIVKGIESLIREGVATQFKPTNPGEIIPVSPTALWESERAAKWLLEQYTEHKQNNLTH